MAAADKITERRAREIAETELRRLASNLGTAGTLPAYDVHIVSTQARRHGWVLRHNARECAEEHRLRYIPDGAPIYVRYDECMFFLPPSGRLEDDIARLEAAFEGKSLEPALFVPKSKSDHNAARNAQALGYPAVAPILPNLLEWMQDMNWPVARTVASLLVAIGAPLAPHLRRVLDSDDEVWKYWIVGELIGRNAELFAFFKPDLERIAAVATEAEHREGVDEQAQDVLAAPPTK